MKEIILFTTIHLNGVDVHRVKITRQSMGAELKRYRLKAERAYGRKAGDANGYGKTASTKLLERAIRGY